MKKVDKVFMIFLLIIAIFASTINISNATDYGATMKLTANKTTANVNDVVTFTLSLQSTTNVDGVTTVHAKIDYDKDVLEYVSCEAANSWSVPVYNSENQEFVIERADVMKPTGDIMKITFKVISVPSSLTTTVAITNFDVADTENEITVENISEDLKIEKKQTENNKPNNDNSGTTQKPIEDEKNTNTDNENKNDNNNNNNNTNNNINNNNTNNNINNNNTNNNISNKNDNTIHNGKMPQTGEEIILPIAIAIFTIIACAFIIKYKKIKF